MSYTNRVDFAGLGEECHLSSTCQLHDGHGGDCDERTEQERWADLYRAFDEGDAAPEEGVDLHDCG